MYLKPLIGIVNLSSNVSNSDVKKMVVAIQEQIKLDVAPAWGRDHCFVMFYEDPKMLSPRAFPIIIVNNDSTPKALGWHTERGGKPYGKVMTDVIQQNCGTVLYDPANPQNITISSALSHEVVAAFIDPQVNTWVDGPQTAQGSCYAMEACDPVENSYYTNKAAGVPVSLSNFVYPAYFINNAVSGTKFDHMDMLSAPFSVAPTGHMLVRKAPGTEVQVFGTAPIEWKLEMKKHKLGTRLTIRMPVKIKKWWNYL